MAPYIYSSLKRVMFQLRTFILEGKIDKEVDVYLLSLTRIHWSIPILQSFTPKDILQGCDLITGEAFWELHLEMNVQVAVVVWSPMFRHAFAFYALPRIRLDHIASRAQNFQHPSIQVFDRETCSTQSLSQSDFLHTNWTFMMVENVKNQLRSGGLEASCFQALLCESIGLIHLLPYRTTKNVKVLLDWVQVEFLAMHVVPWLLSFGRKDWVNMARKGSEIYPVHPYQQLTTGMWCTCRRLVHVDYFWLTFSIMRSLLILLKTLCCLASRTNRTSPGSVSASCRPASPLNTILEPCLWPFSTCTSNTFFSGCRPCRKGLSLEEAPLFAFPNHSLS